MAQYTIQVHCIACGDLHSMGISVALAGLPTKKRRIAERFRGKEFPATIAGLKRMSGSTVRNSADT